MSRRSMSCDYCIDEHVRHPARRALSIVVAVAVGLAAFGTASLVLAGSSASAPLSDKSVFDSIAR